MKILAANSTSIFLLQNISFIIIVFGIFFVDFSVVYILFSVLFFYCYSVIGISMMLHRYYSHNNFELNSFFKYFFTLFAILAGRGSPLGWTYIHRIHHGFADTEKDPHSPNFNTFKIIGFKPIYDESKKINYFIVKDLLTPIQIKIDRYYILIIIFFLLFLLAIDYNLIFYIWALPVFLVSWTQIAFNYFGHKFGYRNFQTYDKSTNNIFLWPFILGDAWHNNHHNNPKNLHSGIHWWELDPISLLIRLIKKK